MCITTTPTKWRESQRSRQKSCELQSTNSKKGKSADNNGVIAEHIKACDDETREMVRQIFNEIEKQNECTPEAWRRVRKKWYARKETWRMWVTTARFSHCLRCTNCSRQFSTNDYTQCLTRNKQKIRLASEKLTKQRTTLRRTEWLSRNATSGESNCGQRQSTSRRRSTPSPTSQFGTPSNLATSITITSASWRRYTETRKHLYRPTKRATWSRTRKEPNRVILCQACFSTPFYRIHWKTTSSAGKRKNKWESAWATTIMTASQTWDLPTTCSYLHPRKNSFKKCCANSRRVLKKWDSWFIQQRRKFFATKAWTQEKKLKSITSRSKYWQEEKARDTWARWLLSSNRRRPKS